MAEGVHEIRLTAAWEQSETGGWLRSFGMPSGLDGGAQVWLVVLGGRTDLQPSLNGRLLGAAASVDEDRSAWEVTQLLARRNSLEFSVIGDAAAPPPTGRLPLPAVYGEVLLEIDEREQATLPQENNA